MATPYALARPDEGTHHLEDDTMKKTVISTIVLGAAGLALAGCGGSADATAQADFTCSHASA